MKNIYNTLKRMKKEPCKVHPCDRNFSAWLLEEDYKVSMFYIIICMTFRLSEVLAGLNSLCAKYGTFYVILYTFSFFSLYKRNKIGIKISYIITALQFHISVYTLPTQAFLVLLPILSITSPAFLFMFTRSALLSGGSAFVNILVLVYKVKDELLELPFIENSPLVVNLMMFKSIQGILVIMGSLAIYDHARKTTVKSLFDQTQKLYDLNEQNTKLNEDLKKSLKGKDDFLLSVSHEIRNPLNIISGNLELAAMNNKDSKVTSFIETSKSSVELLTFLINNLLDAAKTHSNKLEVSAAATDTYAFFEHMWSMATMLLQRRNLQGHMYISKTLPDKISIDANRIMQIVFNLVSNAAKFTRKGGAIIIVTWVPCLEYNDSLMEPTKTNDFNNLFPNCDDEFESLPKLLKSNSKTRKPEYAIPRGSMLAKSRFRTKSTSALDILKYYYRLDNDNPTLPETYENEGNWTNQLKSGFLKIEVRDTGVGMTDTEMSQLFKKFSQVGHDDSSKQLGTGLGLWITQTLLQAMNGDVKVYSELGQGTTFVSVLKSQVCETMTTMTSFSDSGAGDRRRAMVVDDNAMNQMVHKKFLERCQVEVTDVASNGLEALEIYKERGNNFFDVIFMDIDMPIMNGEESIRRIREYEVENHFQQSKMVIITGNCEKKKYEEFQNPKGDIRADFIFSKPFTFQQCMELMFQLASTMSSIPNIDSIFEDKVSESKVVLIVDDDRYNCDIMVQYLASVGLKSIVANNGIVAVSKFMQMSDEIGLVFMDLNMPCMDGYEATKQIKGFCKSKSLEDIPIVGLSGNSGLEVNSMCHDAGMHRLVSKPARYDQVKEVLKQSLKIHI
jgi:signal transduction histidine kinase/response regulator RpfG family c-di-GMP phosphodiesterase